MVYFPTGRLDLILILGCMNSNLLVLELIPPAPCLIWLEIYKPPGELNRGFMVYNGTPRRPARHFLVRKPSLIRSPLNTAKFCGLDQIPEVPLYIINMQNNALSESSSFCHKQIQGNLKGWSTLKGRVVKNLVLNYGIPHGVKLGLIWYSVKANELVLPEQQMPSLLDIRIRILDFCYQWWLNFAINPIMCCIQ